MRWRANVGLVILYSLSSLLALPAAKQLGARSLRGGGLLASINPAATADLPLRGREGHHLGPHAEPYGSMPPSNASMARLMHGSRSSNSSSTSRKHSNLARKQRRRRRATSETGAGGGMPGRGSPLKLFTFHRDEAELLADWAAYHGRIFGPSNIYVLDQQSSDPGVRATLADLRMRGFHVKTLTNKDGRPVEGWVQGRVLTWAMSQVVQKHEEAKLLIPIDVDEFIVLADPLQIRSKAPTWRPRPTGPAFSARPEAIRAALLALLPGLERGDSFKFRSLAAAACDGDAGQEEGTPRRVALATHFSGPDKPSCLHKTFFAARGFQYTFDGNHWGGERDRCAFPRGKCMQCYTRTDLALAHFGGADAMRLETFIRKVEMHAAAFGHIETVRAGRPCSPNLKGVHHCRSFQMLHHNSTLFKESFYANRTLACASRTHSTAILDAVMAATGGAGAAA